MNIYIDCEWNDYGGDLISMALVTDDLKEFYFVLPHPDPTPWVAEHVIPVLGIESAYLGRIVTIKEAQEGLEAFLDQYDGVNDGVNIISDWPEDIAWFCKMLVTGPGRVINTPCRINMELAPIEAEDCYDPDVPHNALSDAREIRAVYEAHSWWPDI